MNIDNLDKIILEKGFPISKLKDVIAIITHDNSERIYRLFILLFYLLGCFNARFYQVSAFYWYPSPIKHNKRMASFHYRDWNPISIIANFVFSILNFFYGKKIIYIEIPKLLVIDVNENNYAYVV